MPLEAVEVDNLILLPQVVLAEEEQEQFGQLELELLERLTLVVAVVAVKGVYKQVEQAEAV